VCLSHTLPPVSCTLASPRNCLLRKSRTSFFPRIVVSSILVGSYVWFLPRRLCIAFFQLEEFPEAFLWEDLLLKMGE